jgi:hypothetical protein
MKEATINGQLTPANPNAPQTGTCPHCGHPVTLRHRGKNWHWRHQPGAPTTCPARFNPTRNDTKNRQSNQRTNEQTSPSCRLAPVLAENLQELILISKEVGANVLILPDTPVTLTLTGPGVIILAQQTNQPANQPTNEESL